MSSLPHKYTTRVVLDRISLSQQSLGLTGSIIGGCFGAHIMKTEVLLSVAWRCGWHPGVLDLTIQSCNVVLSYMFDLPPCINSTVITTRLPCPLAIYEAANPKERYHDDNPMLSDHLSIKYHDPDFGRDSYTCLVGMLGRITVLPVEHHLLTADTLQI